MAYTGTESVVLADVVGSLGHKLQRHEVLSEIDLVKVFDAILTSRQTREKLECLYENLMSNNFLSTAFLKKI